MYGDGKKRSKENIIKNIRKFFKLKKENEAIKCRVTGDIMTIFQKEDGYCKPTRVGNFWNNSYIE